MKEIFITALFLIYSAASMVILLIAMFFLLTDLPTWTGWVIYPLAFVVAVTQGKVLKYFQTHLNF